MISFILENCDVFDIPDEYIENIKIADNKIEKIVIKKSYLKVCNKYHEFAKYIKENISEKIFLEALDITRVDINGKIYYVNYIGEFGLDFHNNILQTISMNDNSIIFSWDIDDKNYIEYSKNSIVIFINRKYQHMFDEDCIVNYWE